MADFSFDIVSKVDLQEVRNALDQAQREIGTRFDFRDSGTELSLDEKKLTVGLHADSETRLNAAVDVLQSKLHRRGIDIQALELGAVEPAAKGTVRQEATIRQGLDTDTARKVVKLLKDRGLKVQAAIQGDQVRVSSKSKDELQTAMAAVRDAGLGLPLQFVNYR